MGGRKIKWIGFGVSVLGFLIGEIAHMIDIQMTKEEVLEEINKKDDD